MLVHYMNNTTIYLLTITLNSQRKLQKSQMTTVHAITPLHKVKPRTKQKQRSGPPSPTFPIFQLSPQVKFSKEKYINLR